MITNNSLIAEIKKGCGRELREEEAIAIEWWVKGRSLGGIVDTEGYRVLLEILESYAEADERRLLSLPAGDSEVVAAHAAASASRINLARLKETVQEAITAAKDIPEVVKEAYRGMPPESV